jgi:hypothetical protein
MDQNPQRPEDQIDVDVRLTLADYLRANYWFLFKRFRRFFLILFLAGVVYPALYLTGAVETTKKDNPWGLLIPWALLLLLLLTTFLGTRRNLKSNRALQGEMHYCFSRDGINTAGPLSSGQMGWAAIRDAFETRSNFLIFISNNLMYLIPKRCLQSGDVVRLRALVSEMLGRKARMRKV